jgi:hypothetical protein
MPWPNILCQLTKLFLAAIQSVPTERHKVVITDGMEASTSGSSYMGGQDDDEQKYTRRAHPLKRSLQRLFPGLFAPGLPVTTR